MSEEVKRRSSWLASELEAEMSEKWKTKTISEIRAAKYKAESKVAAILAELYFETGVNFSVSRSQMIRTDSLNRFTQWDAEESFVVTLTAVI